jgi:hypothetical protein
VDIGKGPDVRCYLRERVSSLSAKHTDTKGSEMNDLFLLEPEFHYHAKRARAELKPVRYRKWRRRLEWDGPDAATDEKNWIN